MSKPRTPPQQAPVRGIGPAIQHLELLLGHAPETHRTGDAQPGAAVWSGIERQLADEPADKVTAIETRLRRWRAGWASMMWPREWTTSRSRS